MSCPNAEVMVPNEVPIPRDPSAAAMPLPGDDLGKFAFLLDIDGTILDLAPSPSEVIVTDGLRQTLTQLKDRTGGALAFVSGRALADIDRIFAPLTVPAIGGHGAELRPSLENCAGSRENVDLDLELRCRLASIAKIDRGILVEDKGYALALHYRRAPDKKPAIEAAIKAICANAPPGSLDILPGKAVLEIKRTSFNKGLGIRKLMTFAPFAGRRPVFVGDDTTDESALAVMADFNGIGLSVGRLLPGAIGHFGAPHEMRTWLGKLATADA
jgi:trehalose 6-phosphate phosphatase